MRQIFQDLSAVAVVTKVLAARGIAHRLALRGTYAARPYCTQYDESDWDFVKRLLADEGISWWWEHPVAAPPGSEMLVLDDSASPRPGPAAFTYPVNMVRPVGKETFPGTWEIVCHHGGAYAVSVVDYVKWLRFLLDLESDVTFYTGTQKVRSDDAWSVFYWNPRYEATKSPMGAIDRTNVLDLDATLAL